METVIREHKLDLVVTETLGFQSLATSFQRKAVQFKHYESCKDLFIFAFKDVIWNQFS